MAERPNWLAPFLFDPSEEVGRLSEMLPTDDPVTGGPAEILEEFLIFRLGEEACAVSIRQVREIVRVSVLTEVPRGPEGLLGVMNLRGEVVPVYDVRLRLGFVESAIPIAGPEAALGKLPRSGRVVVLHGEAQAAGVLVDAVEAVVRLPPSAIGPPEPHAAGQGCIAGIARAEGRQWLLLDLNQALA